MKSEYVLEYGTSCTLAARADVAHYLGSGHPPLPPFLPLQLSAEPAALGALHQKQYIDAAGSAFVVGAGFLHVASYSPPQVSLLIALQAERS